MSRSVLVPGLSPAGVIVPPAALLSLPSSTAWPSANRAIFSRFAINQPHQVRYVLWNVGTASGNVELGIVKLSGANRTSWTKIVTTGVVACPTAGDVRTDLGARVLPPGDYAVYLWADNTTMTTRFGTAANVTTMRIAGLATSQTGGVFNSSVLAWSQQYTALVLEGDT